MADKIVYTKEQLLALLPHRDPFQFVDYVSAFRQDSMIETKLHLRGDEDFFKGHFPGNPVMPGVLVTDGLAQTCGLLYGFSKQERLNAAGEEPTPPELFFLAAANIKFVKPAFPSETITMTAYAETVYSNLYTYKVEAISGRKMIVKGSLTLALVAPGQSA